MFNLLKTLSYFLFTFLLFSCTTGRKLDNVNYLSKIGDSALFARAIEFEPVIQKGDKISITVTGLEPMSAAQFNQTPALAAGAVTATPGGYVVEPNGTIKFPQLGRLKVEGLDRNQLVTLLTDSLVRYVMDPIVTVQFLNFKITVLGEVNRPGTIPLPEGKINLIEALGLSGDITMYGKRDNVLVVRVKNGQRHLGRVDLTSTNVFNSPYYNLQQNDVIYVDMMEEKLKNEQRAEFRGNIGIITSIIGIATSIIVLAVSLTR